MNLGIPELAEGAEVDLPDMAGLRVDWARHVVGRDALVASRRV